MEISKNVQDLGLLSELSYLKLEHKYFDDKNYSRENIRKQGSGHELPLLNF